MAWRWLIILWIWLAFLQTFQRLYLCIVSAEGTKENRHNDPALTVWLWRGPLLSSPSFWKIFEGNVSDAASATWKQFRLVPVQPSRLLHYSRANKYEGLMQTMSENSSRKAAAGLFSVTTVSLCRDEWITFDAELDKARAFNKTIHPAAERLIIFQCVYIFVCAHVRLCAVFMWREAELSCLRRRKSWVTWC